MILTNEIAEYWEQKAHKNVAKWGKQSEDILLLAMMEELGELAQAYLQYTHLDSIEPEEGIAELKYNRIKSELHDMMALGFQLWWVLEKEQGRE